jgi:hypothetical protein
MQMIDSAIAPSAIAHARVASIFRAGSASLRRADGRNAKTHPAARNHLFHQVALLMLPCKNSTGIPASSPVNRTRVVSRAVVIVFAVTPGSVGTPTALPSLVQ